MRIREPFLRWGDSRTVTLAAQWIASDDFVMMDSGVDVVDDLLELHEGVQVLLQRGCVATNGRQC